MLSGDEMLVEIGCITPTCETENEEGFLAHEEIIYRLANEIDSVYGNKAPVDILNIDWKEVELPASGKAALIAGYTLGKICSRDGLGINLCTICKNISKSNPHVYVFFRAFNDSYMCDELYIDGECVVKSSADFPELFESVLRSIGNLK